MIKIMVCCEAGVTSSKLVEALKQEAQNNGIKLMIWSVARSGLSLSWSEADCILLTPQISGSYNEVVATVNNSVAVLKIDETAFIQCDATKILSEALNSIKGQG